MVLSNQPGKSDQLPVMRLESSSSRENLLLDFIPLLIGRDLLQPEAQNSLVAGLCHLLDAPVAGICLFQGRAATGTFQIEAEIQSINLADPTPGWDELLQSGAIFGPNAWISGRGSEIAGLDDIQAGLTEEITAWMGAPLRFGGVNTGALLVGRQAGPPFVESDLKLLAALSEVVAGQLHNQAIIQRLQAANAGMETSREQLLHSRNVLRALFDSFPDGIYIIDRDYHLTAVNMQRARRIGSHPTALVGKVCYQALYNRESPCPECRVWETIYYGESTKQNRRGKSLDGEIQEWELHSYPIRDLQERVVQAILLEQDITDKRRLELTLAQSEKLAAVGQWAASLAHEINNPLTAIIANAQLLEREIPEGDDLRELVDLISRAGERANQVVRNLLNLARKDEYLFGSTDVNQTVERSLSLLQHEFAARAVSLVLEPAESLPPIQGSPDHLQGVWVNLLSNALDSVADIEGEIRVRTYTDGDEICVLIADNGEGIPEEKIAHIFEPFYTTKAPGHGTGLGLSVSQRIIHQHGGRILVESQPGTGTRFTVMLPVS
jgi:two-component system NtrC family sensor kinase